MEELGSCAKTGSPSDQKLLESRSSGLALPGRCEPTQQFIVPFIVPKATKRTNVLFYWRFYVFQTRSENPCVGGSTPPLPIQEIPPENPHGVRFSGTFVGFDWARTAVTLDAATRRWSSHHFRFRPANLSSVLKSRGNVDVDPLGLRPTIRAYACHTCVEFIVVRGTLAADRQSGFERDCFARPLSS